MVWICIFLKVSNAEHLFMYLLVFCVPSLEKCLFRFSACFVLFYFAFFAIELYEFFIYFGCCCCCSIAKPYLTLCNSMSYSPQVPLSIGFPRQEYWRGLSFPSPVDLPDPDQTHVSCLAGVSCLVGTFFTTEPPGESIFGVLTPDTIYGLQVFYSVL